jgi:hypothetical protein
MRKEVVDHPDQFEMRSGRLRPRDERWTLLHRVTFRKKRKLLHDKNQSNRTRLLDVVVVVVGSAPPLRKELWSSLLLFAAMRTVVLVTVVMKNAMMIMMGESST